MDARKATATMALGIAVATMAFVAPRKLAERPAASPNEPVLVYTHVISGILGLTGQRIVINRLGEVVVEELSRYPNGHSRHWRLAPEELEAIMKSIRDAGVLDFRAEYGRDPGDNRVSLTYRWDGREKTVVWYNPPSGPQSPEGWSRIISLLDGIADATM